ncbi:hypothetical protein ERJ75_000811800 [Trypanosoma vivax]|nr:hypothetical protein ERJ75_000811800 [Trypanosoma vivax]
MPTLGPNTDHYWIKFDAFVGTSLDLIPPSKTARAQHAWHKARWKEFRGMSDKFIFRRMKTSTKGAEPMNREGTRGIRMAAKRTIPKGKGVAPPFWTPELTKLDKMVQECKNERKRGRADSLAEGGACRHGARSAEGERSGAVGHGLGELESGEIDKRAATVDAAGTGGGWPSAEQAPAGASIGPNVHEQVNEGNISNRDEETKKHEKHIPTRHRGRAGCCAA